MFFGENEHKGQGRRGRRLFVWWAILCLLLVPLCVAAVLYFPWTQKRVINGFLKKIENTAAVDIRARAYGWSPFSQIRVTSLKVKAGRRDFLRCDTAELSYHLSWKWPYFIPKMLLLDKPFLYLEKDADGRWRIPREAALPGQASVGAGTSTPAENGFSWESFPWPEVYIDSGRIVGFQQGKKILSLQNITGAVPFKVVDGERGPILQIDLGQWMSKVGLHY